MTAATSSPLLLEVGDCRMVLRGPTANGADVLADTSHPEDDPGIALAEIASTLQRLAAATGAADTATFDLVLPPDFVRVLAIDSPGPGQARERVQIAAALEGLTPYPVGELVFVWQPDPDAAQPGPRRQVAIVARETLVAAEATLAAHGLRPRAIVGRGLAGFAGVAEFARPAQLPQFAASPLPRVGNEPADIPVIASDPWRRREAVSRITSALARQTRPFDRRSRNRTVIGATAAAIVVAIALAALVARGGGYAAASRTEAPGPMPSPVVAEQPTATTASETVLPMQVAFAETLEPVPQTGRAGESGRRVVQDAGAAAPAPTGARGPVAPAADAATARGTSRGGASGQPELPATPAPPAGAMTPAEAVVRGMPPPPPGVVYVLDGAGIIQPTAEGVVLPGGTRLFAGLPDPVPPLPRWFAPGATAPAAQPAAVAQPTAGPTAPAGAVTVADPEQSAAPSAAGPFMAPPMPPRVVAAMQAAAERRRIAPPLPRPAPAAPAEAAPAVAAAEAAPRTAVAAPSAGVATGVGPGVAALAPLPFAPPPRPARGAPPEATVAIPPESLPARTETGAIGADGAPAAAAAPAEVPAAVAPLPFAPPARPPSAAAAAAETAAPGATAPVAAVETATARLGFAPPERPAGLKAPERPVVAVLPVAPPPQRPAGLKAPERSVDPGAPAVVSDAPAVRTPSGTEKVVANEATVRGLDMGRLNLIGVVGTQRNRTALIREVDGRIRRVKVGDRLDGGKVAAIGTDELRYVRDGQNITLRMPRN